MYACAQLPTAGCKPEPPWRPPSRALPEGRRARLHQTTYTCARIRTYIHACACVTGSSKCMQFLCRVGSGSRWSGRPRGEGGIVARPWRVTTDCIAFHVSSTSMCGASAVGRRLRVWLLIARRPIYPRSAQTTFWYRLLESQRGLA